MHTCRQLVLALGLLVVLGTLARADDQADARAIVEKSIKATGGLEKYAKYTGGIAKGKGTIQIMGMSVPFTMDYRFQYPDKTRAEIDAEVMGAKIKVIEILNGSKGWVKVGEQVNDMDENKLVESKNQLYALLVTSLLPLRDKSFTLSTQGEAKIDGAEAVGVRVVSKGQPDFTLFFDKQTGLLVKSQHRTKDSMANGAEIEEETIFTDYKEKNGIMMSMKNKILHDGKLFIDFEMEDTEFVEKHDDGLFGKP